VTIEDQLRYFLVAARQEHLGRAAEELGLSQPALSRSISRLEEEYGIKLFDRASRRIRLNTAGRLLVGHFERALAELEDARRVLQDGRQDARNTISIGFLATFGARLIPGLIRGYKAVDPTAQFRLLQGPYPLLHELLVKGEIDFCLVSPRFADSALDWRPLFEEELVMIVPRGHRLESRGEIDLREVAKLPMVALKRGFGLRQTVEDLTRQAGFVPNIAFEGEEVATLQGLVGAGFGVALTPKSSVGRSDLVVSLSVREPPCRRTIGLSWRQGRYISRKSIDFRDHVMKTLTSAAIAGRQEHESATAGPRPRFNATGQVVR
jgi:DNA-binding transcriptional LysR family regulator